MVKENEEALKKNIKTKAKEEKEEWHFLIQQ